MLFQEQTRSQKENHNIRSDRIKKLIKKNECHFLEATCFFKFLMNAKSEHFFSCMETTRVPLNYEIQSLPTHD